MIAAVLPLVCGLAAPPADVPPPQIAVLDVAAAGGVPPQLARAVGDALLAELQRRVDGVVLGASEIATMLPPAQQRRHSLCSTDACLVEIGGALGVTRLVSAQMWLVGDAVALATRLLEIPTGRILATFRSPWVSPAAVVEQTSAAAEALLGGGTAAAAPTAIAPAPVAQAETTAEAAPVSWPRRIAWALVAAGAGLAVGTVIAAATMQSEESIGLLHGDYLARAAEYKLDHPDASQDELEPFYDPVESAVYDRNVKVVLAWSLGAAAVAALGTGTTLLLVVTPDATPGGAAPGAAVHLTWSIPW